MDEAKHFLLSEGERHLLRRIARAIIPASEVYGVPGADDEQIFSDIVRSIDRDADGVRRALAAISALDAATGNLDAAFSETLTTFRNKYPDDAAVLSMVVAQCYYRDDRVMRGIGMEPRSPFPIGFEVPAGDLSLLDPVVARGPIYRPDR